MSGFSVFLVFLFFVMLGAWCYAIYLFIEAAREKGYFKDGGTAHLWFVGIFATPIVVGLYTTSLPDKRLGNAIAASSGNQVVPSIQDELPSL